MKQIYIQNTVQNPKGIVDAISRNLSISARPKPLEVNVQNHLSIWGNRGEALKFGGFNIFLNQNFGKAPPGRSRSPGAKSYPEHPPDAKKGVILNVRLRVRQTHSVSSVEGLFQDLPTREDRPRNEFGVTIPIFEYKIHTEQTFLQILKLKFLQTFNFLLS